MYITDTEFVEFFDDTVINGITTDMKNQLDDIEMKNNDSEEHSLILNAVTLPVNHNQIMSSIT